MPDLAPDIVRRLTDIDRPGRCDTKDGLEKGRRVGRQNADSSVAMVAKVICQSSRTVGGFLIRALEDLVVRCDVVYCNGLTTYQRIEKVMSTSGRRRYVHLWFYGGRSR